VLDTPATGEEFRNDGRMRLSAEQLRPLTRLDPLRSTAAIGQTLLAIAAVIGLALTYWTPAVVIPAVIAIGVLQHALFVLAHDAAHYRLYDSRVLNDGVGRVIGALGGISMCTYRVIHRLHHNHLYTDLDPDVPLHGGYPRGRGYLLRKLGADLIGRTAWKNYAYFFGHPSISGTGSAVRRVLDDTSPALRARARADRGFVVVVQATLLIAAFASGHALHYLILWIVPALTVLQALLRLRAICEHGAVSDLSTPLKSARTNVVSALWRMLLFPHHVNHHLAHHLYPAVPHYRLPRLHAMLQAQGMLRDAEVRDIQFTLRRVFAPSVSAHP